MMSARAKAVKRTAVHARRRLAEDMRVLPPIPSVKRISRPKGDMGHRDNGHTRVPLFAGHTG